MIEVYLTIYNLLLEIGFCELVGDVPAKRPKLPPLLDSGVEEGDCVEHAWASTAMGQVGVLQVLLAGVGVRPLQAGLYTLRMLKGVLDGSLEQVDGVLVMDLGGEPETECIMDTIILKDCLK